MSLEQRSRLRVGDLFALGFHGSRARPGRAVLSSLGIAIGIAAMISVIGISTSSQALVKDKLASLGTNLLTITAGADLFGEDAKLPRESVAQVKRIPGVTSAGSTSVIDKLYIYRNSEIESSRTGGLSVAAVDLDLLEASGAQLLHGVWLNGATAELPVVVLGKGTAERLGIQTPGSLVWLGGQQFSVAGILGRVPAGAGAEQPGAHWAAHRFKAVWARVLPHHHLPALG